MTLSSRSRLSALGAAVGVLSLAFSGAAAASTPHHHRVFHGKRTVLTAAQIRRLAAGAKKRSIIIFKNQLPGLPARGHTAKARARRLHASSRLYRTDLAQVHATHVHSFHIVNAISATISSAEAEHLSANPRSARSFPTPCVTSPRWAAARPGLPAPARRSARGSHATAADLPENPAQPLIEPEARQVMNVDAAEQIVDGTGVKVGIVADGIDPNNPDLIRANGHTSSSTIRTSAGSATTRRPMAGRRSWTRHDRLAGQPDLRPVGLREPGPSAAAGLQHQDQGHRAGREPGGDEPVGPQRRRSSTRQIIQAIEWAVMHDHVNVLNESIGGNPLPNTQNDPVSLADQAAVAAGVTVVASSGDAGPFNNIGSPATTPGVIAVGGTTTYRVYRQTTRYGTQLSPGGWENNNITALSSAASPSSTRTPSTSSPPATAAGRCAAPTPPLLRLRRHRPRRQPAADLGRRRHQRVGARDLRHRRAGHPGLRQHPRRQPAVAGSGQADHRQHRHRPRRASRPPGRRAGQLAQGRPAGRVDQRRHAGRATRCWSASRP